MNRPIRTLGIATGVLAGTLGLTASPALGQATTIDCSKIFPELGGTLVFTPNQKLLGNCWEHHHSDGGGSEGGSAEVVDCEDQIQPGNWIGIAVHTPEGGTYINCHLHFK